MESTRTTSDRDRDGRRNREGSNGRAAEDANGAATKGSNGTATDDRGAVREAIDRAGTPKVARRIATRNGQAARSPEQLPRGRHGLSRAEVIASQRQRTLDAMAELCAEHGYPSVRIAEIVGRAGVSRATFYELFRDKEDCFVAAMEEGVKRLFNAVMPAAYGGDPDRAWPERVADAIDALLTCIASHKAYSQMAMVEALAGGERSFERYTVASQTLVTLLDQGRIYAPPETRIPSSAARAAQGASEAMIIEEMIAGRVDRVPDLLPDLLYIALTPYVGQAEALEHVASIRRH